MGHFAHINNNNVVDEIIVAEYDFIKQLPDPERWIKTSYNMCGGVYYDPATNLPAADQTIIDGDEARERKNYAGIGMVYDTTRDAFIPEKPYNSWVLNETSCLWEAPVSEPDDDQSYEWDEASQNWVLEQE